MRTHYLVVLMLLGVTYILFASVDLEVGDGVLVETTGELFVEIDGALTETGSGYFKGKISSGQRTGLDDFAGMTLSSGVDGVITRTTGQEYAKGNGEQANFLRFYEIENTGGSPVTIDISLIFVSTGDHDERNSLVAPYYIFKYKNEWTRYGDGSATSPLTGTGVEIPQDSSDWVISDENFMEVGILGDVNNDGLANSSDALIVLSCDVGINTTAFCPMSCGDTNKDTWVNSSDALIILSYDVGITVPFPVGEPGCPTDVHDCLGCTP